MKTNFAKLLARITLVIFCFTMTVEVSAQSAGNTQQKDKKEKIQAAKIGFITNEINLTPTEATKFWPLYNEFESKKKELNQPKRQMEQSLKKLSPENITEKQAGDLLTLQLTTEQNQLNLKKEYIDKFKAVIGVKKTAQLFQAEKKFNDFLLKQLKESKPPKGGE